MTNEFKDILISLGFVKSPKWEDPKSKPPEVLDNLEIKWLTGGLTGGNCWGDFADCPVDSEAEPEFEQLDKLLERLCPTISFLQYKRLVQELVQTDSHHESAYYGNYYSYSLKRVNLTDLEKYLRDHNLWQG